MDDFSCDKRSITIFLIALIALLVIKQMSNCLAKETISFSGYTWQVKHSIAYPVGPGPNYFSASGRNVRTDESGNLHLRLDEHRGKWYATEVWLDRSLGYGTYRFTVNFPEELFDENVVFGLFNYLDDRKEFDIEVSKWGEETSKNAGYAVQPASLKKNTHRFSLDLEKGSKKIFSFTWTGDGIIFRCENCSGASCARSTLTSEWEYSGGAIPTGDLKTHVNLWLVNGIPPTDGREAEVVLEDFSFTPLGK